MALLYTFWVSGFHMIGHILKVSIAKLFYGVQQLVLLSSSPVFSESFFSLTNCLFQKDIEGAWILQHQTTVTLSPKIIFKSTHHESIAMVSFVWPNLTAKGETLQKIKSNISGT